MEVEIEAEVEIQKSPYVYIFYFNKSEQIIEKELIEIEKETDYQLQINPLEIKYLQIKSQILYKYHINYNDALILIQKVLLIDPLNLDSRIDLFLILMYKRVKNTAKLSSLIKECIQLDPDYWRGMYAQGVYYQYQENQEKAYQITKQAFNMHPNIQLIKTFYLQLSSKLDQENPKIEEMVLKTIDEKNDSDCLARLAYALSLLNQYGKQENILKKALFLNPKSGKILNNYGYFERKIKGNNKKCIEYCEQAIKYFPNDDDPYFNIAMAYSNNQEYNLSNIYFKKCIGINKYYQRAYLELAFTYYQELNQQELGKQYILKFKRVFPNDTSFNFILFDQMNQNLNNEDLELLEECTMEFMNKSYFGLDTQFISYQQTSIQMACIYNRI